MVLAVSRRIKKWARGLRQASTSQTRASADVTVDQSVDLTDPLINYYRHRTRINLSNLYRFALQTRSMAIRDVFARVAFSQHVPLEALLEMISDCLDREVPQDNYSEITTAFDSSVLLALADLMANTARDDLDTYAAVQIYEFVRTYFGADALSSSSILLNVEALHDLGEHEKSQALAKSHDVDDFAPLQTELLHLKRLHRSRRSCEGWLQELNELYSRLNMSQVRLLEDGSLPLIDRLSAASTIRL